MKKLFIAGVCGLCLMATFTKNIVLHKDLG